MKQVRKIYDKAFKEKAVQLSYERTNVSEISPDVEVVTTERGSIESKHRTYKRNSESYSMLL